MRGTEVPSDGMLAAPVVSILGNAADQNCIAVLGEGLLAAPLELHRTAAQPAVDVRYRGCRGDLGLAARAAQDRCVAGNSGDDHDAQATCPQLQLQGFPLVLPPLFKALERKPSLIPTEFALA